MKPAGIGTHPVWAELPGVKQEDADSGEELVRSYFRENPSLLKKVGIELIATARRAPNAPKAVRLVPDLR